MKNIIKTLLTITLLTAILFALLSITFDPLMKLLIIGVVLWVELIVVVILVLRLSKLKK